MPALFSAHIHQRTWWYISPQGWDIYVVARGHPVYIPGFLTYMDIDLGAAGNIAPRQSFLVLDRCGVLHAGLVLHGCLSFTIIADVM